MASIILTTICAVALGTTSLPASADTTNVYIVDNVEVRNFSGSQLNGKTITAYDISYTTRGSATVRVHSIKTAPFGNTIQVTPQVTGPSIEAFLPFPMEEILNPVYFLDGNIISEEEFLSLDTAAIAGVRALKEASATEYLQPLKDEGKYDGPVTGCTVVIVTSRTK